MIINENKKEGSRKGMEAVPFVFPSNSNKWQRNRQMKLDVTLLAVGGERRVAEGRAGRRFFWEISCHVSLVNARGAHPAVHRGNNGLDLGYSSNRNIIRCPAVSTVPSSNSSTHPRFYLLFYRLIYSPVPLRNVSTRGRAA